MAVNSVLKEANAMVPGHPVSWWIHATVRYPRPRSGTLSWLHLAKYKGGKTPNIPQWGCHLGKASPCPAAVHSIAEREAIEATALGPVVVLLFSARYRGWELLAAPVYYHPWNLASISGHMILPKEGRSIVGRYSLWVCVVCITFLLILSKEVPRKRLRRVVNLLNLSVLTYRQNQQVSSLIDGPA